MDDNEMFSSCKDKLSRFRLKELKDVLSQLGLSKQGKKQELNDRILASLFQEQEIGPSSNGSGSVSMSAARIIEETYRKMYPETCDAPTGAGSNKGARAKKENGEVSSSEMKVRCPCDSSLFTDSMVKCVECNVWQHTGCVIVPENVAEGGAPVVPPNFYCEMCRVARADPFWVAVKYPLEPVIVDPCLPSVDGKPAVQIMERGFQLTAKDREMLEKSGYELQVCSILFNDTVPFRMHWPLYPELHVNGLRMRVTTRPNQQPLGCNGRDDCPLIGTCCREGYNKISFSRADSRKFCFAIKIARHRSLNEVLSMIPKEEEGETYEEALARVRRCIGGGTTTGNADDSDSDIELVSNSVTVNLRCPMSGLRMKVAGRFKPCAHMGCFDLETFVALNERARKWQCPICLKNYSLESTIIDPYFNRITSLIKQEMFMESDQEETKPSIQKLQSETKIPKIESVVGTSGLNGHGSHEPEGEEEIELIVLSDSDDDTVAVLDPPVDSSDLMDLDSSHRPGPSGENSTVQPIVDAATVLHSMNGGNSYNTQQVNEPGPTSGSRTQSPYSTFCPPRQPRSAKRRVILSIDSDSD
ncbi:E3 SUMO-protein ligase SIZ1-like isoform X2 [Carex littledalei]|uniref:E3 SUMO-protein ligase SIZ1-like isoform X2 n=1 Tax=Carex littledalei TaxID=544730 RepID=A0A833VKD9_9POAL|nr:E3 SUMO-protein ligase SIZ1-like isoform X2 [Carex littledalei]